MCHTAQGAEGVRGQPAFGEGGAGWGEKWLKDRGGLHRYLGNDAISVGRQMTQGYTWSCDQ